MRRAYLFLRSFTSWLTAATGLFMLLHGAWWHTLTVSGAGWAVVVPPFLLIPLGFVLAALGATFLYERS